MLAPVIDASTATIDLTSLPGIHRRNDLSFYVDDWILEALQRSPHQIDKSRTSERRSEDTEKADDILSLSDTSFAHYIDPSADLAKKQLDIAKKHFKAFQALTVRLNELKTDARSEGHTVSLESEKDLMVFLSGRIFIRRPFITLLDNGNLRVLWKNPEGEQIGLQFRGGKVVQYVLFARRPDGDFMARSSGRDTLSDIGGHINAHNLKRLMAA